MQQLSQVTFGRKALFVGLIGVLAAPAALAQEQQQQQWVTLMYRKTEPGKAADFRKFAEGAWKKVAQAGIDDGSISGAMVLRLTAPYASGAGFDYVTVNFPKKRPSVAPMDQAAWDARVRKAGFTSMQQYMDAVGALAKTVKTEWMTSSMRIGSAQAGNYMRSMRYAVDREHRQAVGQFLREYSMPLQAARMKDGSLQGWAVNLPAMVSPEEAGFAMSVSFISKDADAAMGGPGRMTEEWFNKALPGKSYAAYLNQLNAINSMRKPVSTRIFEVVAAVGSMPEAALPSSQ